MVSIDRGPMRLRALARQLSGVRVNDADVFYDPPDTELTSDTPFTLEVSLVMENLESIDKTFSWNVLLNETQVATSTTTIQGFETSHVDSVSVDFQAPVDDPDLPSSGVIDVFVDSAEFSSELFLDEFTIEDTTGGNGGGNGGGDGGVNAQTALLAIGAGLAIVFTLGRGGDGGGAGRGPIGSGE